MRHIASYDVGDVDTLRTLTDVEKKMGAEFGQSSRSTLQIPHVLLDM